jgi:hypothetical protein
MRLVFRGRRAVVLGVCLALVGWWSLAYAATRADFRATSSDDPPVWLWALGSLMISQIGLTLGLWRWVTIEMRSVKNEQIEFDGALRGYKGQGGALQDIRELQQSTGTIDERITASRHDVRSEFTDEIIKAETTLLVRMQDFEQRINQRISDLGFRTRQRDGGT